MPIVEVTYARKEPLDKGRKRAFFDRATHIFNEDLGTRSPSLRTVFQYVKPEDSKLGLVDEAENAGR